MALDRRAQADAAAFDEALRNVDLARYWRERKTELAAAGTTTADGATVGRCEANARRAENRVRQIALVSEILLANRARAAARPQA